jgi:APA family basic amino acid/polyamine antiporter
LDVNWHPKLGDKFVRRPRAKARPLKRVLGVFALFSYGYGDVGSSIYYALGLVALIAAGATPVVLLVAGIFFIFTALSYAEGTAMIPEAGGSASFARRGFNDLLASTAGWALAFSYIVTMAISAYAVPSYLGYFWAPLKESAAVGTLAAMGIVFFLMLLNVVGVKESSILNSAFAVLDIVTQILIIVLAVLFIFDAQVLLQRIETYWPSWSELVFGVAVASIAYTGVETISQLSEETRRPSVNAPKALVLMMVVVLVLFSGISVAGFSAMTPPEMASEWARDPIAGIAHGFSMRIVPLEVAAGVSSDPEVAVVFAALLSGLLKLVPVLVAVLAATILTIATNAGLMGISRLTFSLGRFQFLPLALSKVHPSFKTPYRAIILYALVAILLLVPGFLVSDIFVRLGGLYAFGSLLAFALAHASIIRLRIRHPEIPRPFKLKGNIMVGGHELPITAILGLVATSVIWIIVVIVQPYARWVGFGWMAFGTVVYVLFRRRKQLPLTKVAPVVKVPID